MKAKMTLARQGMKYMYHLATLKAQIYLTYVVLVFPSPTFDSVLLHDELFSKYRVVENRKRTE